MRFFIGVLLITCLVSCQNVYKTPDPLLVESVNWQENVEQDYNQLLFRFNQPVAAIGQVPSAQHIDAIETDKNIHCVWRFIDTRTLSCELSEGLALQTEFTIRVNKTFKGISSTLSKPFEHTLKTPSFSPKLIVDVEYKNTPRILIGLENIYERIVLDQHLATFSQALQLVDPAGTAIAFQLVEHKSNRKRLVLDNQHYKNGYYRLFLKKGFALNEQSYPLEEDVFVSEFYLDKEPRFLGLFCILNNTQLTLEQTIDCPPGLISAKFSRPLTINIHRDKRFPWIAGYHKITGMRNSAGIVEYALHLDGNTFYSMNLDGIEVQNKTVEKEHLINTETFTFTTPASTPFWALTSSTFNQIQGSDGQLPFVIANNVNNLVLDYTAVQSASELLQYLKKPTTQHSMPIPMTETSAIHLSAIPVDIHGLLQNTTSGLVFGQISGNSVRPVSTTKTIEIEQKKQRWEKSISAFNLSLLKGSQLLISAHDWKGSPIADTQIQLVCAYFSNEKHMGTTDKNGLLLLEKNALSFLSNAENEDDQCWLWATNSQGTAHIPFFRSDIDFTDNTLLATAWSDSPIYQVGDLANIGVTIKKTGSQGIRSLSESNRFAIKLVTSSGKSKPLTLDLSEPTGRGIYHGKVTIPRRFNGQSVHVLLWDKQSDQNRELNRFSVAEFTPPEFSVRAGVPDTITKDHYVNLDVEALRMNGVPLQHGKSHVNFQFKPSYTQPASWPKQYRYSNWKEFRLFNNDNEKKPPLTDTLDTNGQASFTHKFKHDIPFAQLQTNITVIADDGASQHSQNSSFYFARSYIIGTRYLNEDDQISIIAVTPKGNTLSQVNGQVFTLDKDGNHLKAVCSFTHLPARCDTTEIDSSDDFAITTEHDGIPYRWIRDIYKFTHTAKKGLEVKTDKQQYRVGDTVNVSVTSPNKAKVRLVLTTDAIEKVWFVEPNTEDASFTFPVTENFAPGFRLYAQQYIQQDSEQNKNQHPLQSLNEITRSRPRSIVHGDKLILSDETTAQVVPNDALLTSKITLQGSSFNAGSTVKVSIEASQNADVQLWLVNDAILQLMAVSDEDLLEQHDFYRQHHLKRFNLDSVSAKLSQTIDYNNADFHNFAEAESLSVAGLRQREAAFSFADAGQSPTTRFNASQILWLDSFSVQQGKPITKSIHLPDLIGRWRLLALTVNETQNVLNHSTFTTYQDVEYFLDTPRVMYEDDKGYFAFNVINRHDKPVTQQLTVLLNDKEYSTLSFTLAANEQKRLNYPLNGLNVGLQTLSIADHTQGVVAQSHINVRSSVYAKQQRFFVDENDARIVQLPQNPVSGSVAAFYSTGTDNLDWVSFNRHIQDYPHICWEQNLSRALAYTHNPIAKQQWPDGINAFQRSLDGFNRYTDYNQHFAFYPRTTGNQFLTAYTLFAASYLAEFDLSIPFDTQTIARHLLDELEKNNNKTQVSAHYMTLMALSKHGDLPLEKLRSLAENFGMTSAFSQLLYANALKFAGADENEYLSVINQLIQTGYQDSQQALFNQNVENCLSLIVQPNTTTSAIQQAQKVIAQQNQEGHFGNTFADGICSIALKDKTQGRTWRKITVTNQKQIEFSNDSAPIWVKLDYTVPITSPVAVNNGLTLGYDSYVLVDNQWQKLVGNELSVGDIVQLEISLNSPVNRQHIAVTADIPAGLEVINPSYDNIYYQALAEKLDTPAYSFFSQTPLIEEGKLRWYFDNLYLGKRSLSVFARVRLPGEYQSAPIKAEAMYRSDVFAELSIDKIKIRTSR